MNETTPAAADPADVVPANGPPPADGLRDEVAGLRRAVAALETAVAAGLDGLAKQVGFLPPQVRGLGAKVDGLTTSVGEARCRALLLGLLGVYDLLDRIERNPTAGPDPDAEHRQNYRLLRTQVRQLLEANGLTEVPADGPFDPAVHRALQTRPCADPALADRVLEVVSPGFRTDQAVLRYAEVVVGKYAAPAAGDGAG